MFYLFDRVHLGWLAVIALFLVILIVSYKRAVESTRYRIRFTLACTISIAELIKWIVVLLQGKSLLYYLPIHLCGLAIFLLLLDVLRPTLAVKEILFSLTLPGALIALAFPGWTAEPIMGFLHIHSFIYHAIILAYPVMLLVTGELKPQIKQLWKVIIFLCLIIPSIYWFNEVVGTNYMFLNRPIEHSPLMTIYEAFGDTGYIWGLMLVALVMWVIQYGITSFITFARKNTTVR